MIIRKYDHGLKKGVPEFVGHSRYGNHRFLTVLYPIDIVCFYKEGVDMSSPFKNLISMSKGLLLLGKAPGSQNVYNREDEGGR